MHDVPASNRPERSETIALLALLRDAPKGMTWSDISTEVRIAGSAVSVLNQTRGTDGALLPDPELSHALERAASDLAGWEAAGLNLLTVLSEQYPTRLAGVFDCPPFIFTQGRVVPDDKGMSVVGSRKATSEGLTMARTAARLLAERDLTVIAGLAEGIDAAAHREALALGARTVAVIGTGITRHYPPFNQDLQDEIAVKGLVVSQFYPDQPPTAKTFPMRNGTMSGYGLATIVVEAGEHSGSRIQARKAADHGRPVILSRQVATTTSWGGTMARDPWVTVVSSTDALADAIDRILDRSGAALVETLGLVPA
jgi:DNA processing protein